MSVRMLTISGFILAIMFLCAYLRGNVLVSDAIEVRASSGVNEESEWPLLRDTYQRLVSGRNKILSDLFVVNRVQVEGNYYVSNEEILKVTGLSERLRFWQISPLQLASILKSHSWIQEAHLKWLIYPIELTIAVKEEEPWLVAEFGGDTWLVSRTGAVIQTLRTLTNSDLIVRSSELPRLNGIELSADVGSMSTSDKRLSRALGVLRLFRIAGGFPFPVERFTLLPEGGVLVSPFDTMSLPRVVVDANSFEEAQSLLSRIDLVLGDMHMREEKASEIDLRFNGQAVVRTGPKGS